VAHSSSSPVRIRLLGTAVLAALACVLGATAPVARADVTTIGAGPLRTSWDSNEPALGPAAVGSSSFGQLFAAKVDGQVYAQPLVVSNTVIAATENDRVYGLDKSTGRQLWSTDLGPSWPASNVSCGDLAPNVGITSTPVYDPATNAVYLTAKTNDGAGADFPNWKVHALDPATGAERPGWPITISGAPANDPTHPFNARTAAQRPGLLLLGGVVYAGFASHCDTGPFVGYVIGFDTRTARQTTMWATESGNAVAEGGIWQSGGGLVADAAGRIYLATGNGISPPRGPGKQPPSTLAESVVALTTGAGGALAPTDFFSPSDNAKLDQDDADLGSGGPLAVPDGYGTSAHPHLLVQVGKSGKVYLLDRDDLGGMGQGAGGGDRVLDTAGPYSGVWGKPAFFGSSTGGYVYTVENQGYLRAYKLVAGANGAIGLAAVGASAGRFGYSSGSPVVTSNGKDGSSALVWAVYASGNAGGSGELRAYSALPDAGGVLQQRFSAPIGTAAKFSSVATDGGRVYVGTRDGTVYGFGSPTTAAFKAAPVSFAATAVGSATTATVTLTATRAVTLKSPATATAPFSVVSGPAAGTVVPAGGSVAVTLRFAPTDAGQASAVLSLVTTAGETVRFDVHGLATRPGIAAAPASAAFGDVPTGLASLQTVTIVNTGTAPFQLGSVTGPSAAGFTVTPSWDGAGGTVLAPQESAAVALTYAPTAAGPVSDRLTVTGTLSAAEGGGPVSLSVPVTATAIQGAPHLQLPAGLDFGSVPVGSSKTLPFEIDNTGNVPLTITKAKAPAGVFSTTDPISEGLVIPPGSSAYQTVTFTPTAAGKVSGPSYFYELTGNDGQAAQEVMLSGAGVNDPIAVKFEQLGGGRSLLGQAVTGEYAVAGGQGQDFVNGSIYWSAATGAHAVRGAIVQKYRALNGPKGFLGFPTTDELSSPDTVGRLSHFAHGSIYFTPASGAHSIGGGIRAKWAQTGWELGPLGYPTTDELVSPDKVGRFNHFTNGSIYSTPATGAHEILGAIQAKWAQTGWELGPLGYPTTDELVSPDKVGRFNHFSRNNTSIYFTPATGAHEVGGAIRAKWGQTGWELGPLGYPTTDELVSPDGVGRFNHFSKGNASIYFTRATGAHEIGGAIRAKWAETGWELGPLGYPTTDELGSSDKVGRFNFFSRGDSAVYFTAATGAHVVSGAIRVKWVQLGSEFGIGYPTGDTVPVSGGSSQTFQRGRLTFTTRTGAVVLAK
jgi:uncharacterized protein with LGFP repeats